MKFGYKLVLVVMMEAGVPCSGGGTWANSGSRAIVSDCVQRRLGAQ